MDDYWIWFDRLTGISVSRKERLLIDFKNPKEIFTAAFLELIDYGIDNNVFTEYFSQKSLDAAKRIHYEHDHLGIRQINPDHSLYRSGAGFVTYYKGNLHLGKSCAVIGTRKCTAFGVHYTKRICEELVEDEICINSGLALGIDKWAHLHVLESLKGKTQAFIANGIDICYPREHSRMMSQILERGAVISPFPVGVMPLKHNFLIRNRLMSLWSDRIIVVEAPKKSGALITAEYGRHFGKPVLTVNPKSDSLFCEGNRLLMSKGANEYVFRGSDDYIETLSNNALLNLIRGGSLSMEELNTKTDLTFSVMEPLLLKLESDHLIAFKCDGKWHYNGW